MKRKFEFEFEDTSLKNRITFEHDSETEEKMSVVVEDHVPVIYLNRQALLFLAKTFIKMALGEYSTGFHLHFGQDFDGERPEAIRIVLDD